VFERVLIGAALVLHLAAAGADERAVRDPMQPFRAAEGAAAAEIAAPRYALTAVLISAARRIAVVNGQLYRQGDIVDGAEVVQIEPNAVHLRAADGSFVIRLASARAPAPSEGDSGQ
jgi:hypothetical protein